MYHSHSNDPEQNKVMTEDQFNLIVEAIASGKYSWACLLVLRFAGYNPMHYIPYRTYNRLMKGDRDKKPSENQEILFDCRSPSKVRDLACLEDIDSQAKQVLGGKKLSSFTFPISNFRHR